MGKGKRSPYSTAERKVPELILVLGSQPAGDVSHKPGGNAQPLVDILNFIRQGAAAMWPVGVISLDLFFTLSDPGPYSDPKPTNPPSPFQNPIYATDLITTSRQQAVANTSARARTDGRTKRTHNASSPIYA